MLLIEFLALERLDARLPLGVGENQLDLLLHLFQLLIAEARETDALLEELQRLIERHLLRLQTLHDRLEMLKGFFEFIRLAGHHSPVVGHTVSSPIVFASTVHSRRPVFNCTSIGSPIATATTSMIGLRRPRFVREKAMA